VSAMQVDVAGPGQFRPPNQLLQYFRRPLLVRLGLKHHWFGRLHLDARTVARTMNQTGQVEIAHALPELKVAGWEPSGIQLATCNLQLATCDLQPCSRPCILLPTRFGGSIRRKSSRRCGSFRGASIDGFPNPA